GEAEGVPRSRRQPSDAAGWERPPSPNGSIDPILSGKGSGGKTKTEITVGLQDIMSDEEEEDDIAQLPAYVAKPTPRR
ncbi:hypothetical protein LTR75_014728, partial [Friedmanniomyces endolithicus]